MVTSLKTSTIIRHPKRISHNTLHEVPDGTVATPINGKEYSYSLWFYIEEFVDRSGDVHIMSRGNDVFEILYSRRQASSDKKLTAKVYLKDQTLPLDLEVSYMPIQRWVNLTVVVDNNYITLFMDGDIYAVKDTGTNVVKSSTGEFKFGNKDSMSSFDMIVSNVKFFNYVLSVNDVRSLYAAGPSSKNVLGMLGLPMYGLRNPFYRIDRIQDTIDEDF